MHVFDHVAVERKHNPVSGGIREGISFMGAGGSSFDWAVAYPPKMAYCSSPAEAFVNKSETLQVADRYCVNFRIG